MSDELLNAFYDMWNEANPEPEPVYEPVYQSSQGQDVTDMNSAAAAASNNNSSSNNTGGGATSPLLQGEMTFEELIGEICNGIDLVFIVRKNTVAITDYESLYAEAKYLRDNYQQSVNTEDIKLWQLADGSYELDIEDYGFYTTVEVNYSNGTVKESIEDLVRVYGEVKITYDEPNIDKTTAIMKAKAYLAAHLREFNVTVKGELLHDGDIDIGDIITLENPHTMSNYIHKVEIISISSNYILKKAVCGFQAAFIF